MCGLSHTLQTESRNEIKTPLDNQFNDKNLLKRCVIKTMDMKFTKKKYYKKKS